MLGILDTLLVLIYPWFSLLLLMDTDFQAFIQSDIFTWIAPANVI